MEKWQNAICLGKARERLAGLADMLAGQIALVYMDPPFLTGKDFTGSYSDRFDSLDGYLVMMREAIEGCHALLSDTGSLYLHVDYRVSAHMRLMLDEIFGASRFRNEIIWAYSSGGRAKNHFSRKHDTIYFYTKGDKYFFDGNAAGVPRAGNNHMKRMLDSEGRAYRQINSGGKVYTYYDDDLVPPSDVWTDISHLQQRDPERTGYATQKPLKLLTRIIRASSRLGDIVLDPFCGSGTTLHAAALLGRRFVGVDAGKIAVDTASKRLKAAGIDFVIFP